MNHITEYRITQASYRSYTHAAS